MDYHLVCVHPFGKYQKGDVVTDPEEWARLADDHEHRFVRIAPSWPTTVIEAVIANAEPVAFAGVADEPAVKPVPKGKPV